MAEYIIFFNQQWVGDHTEEWFRGRGPLAMAVVEEIKAAGVYVFAGGLEEEVDTAFSADATSGTLMFTDGPFVETKEFLGGLTVVDVADDEVAKMWAGKIAEACGCRTQTVENIRERLVTEGFETTLQGKPKSRVRSKVLDGEQEAKIIALGLGHPPQGWANWTLRLLAEHAVMREIAESVRSF
jgi:hypothetical protein